MISRLMALDNKLLTTWCMVCNKQNEYLNQMNEHFNNFGVSVLGVNINSPDIVNKVNLMLKRRR